MRTVPGVLLSRLLLIFIFFSILPPGRAEPGALASSQAPLDSAVVRLQPEGAPASQLELLLRLGIHRVSRGEGREGEGVLRDALARAVALGDSLRVRAALRWLSISVALQGRRSEAHEMHLRLLRSAREASDPVNEGWAEVGLAWDAGIDGLPEDAEAGYHRALHLFESAGEDEGISWTLNALGTAYSSLGRFAEAQACFERAASGARAAGIPLVEAMACNNLGSLQYSLGDPGLAMSSFARAAEIQDGIGQKREAVYPKVNRVTCLLELGRWSEADEILDGLLEVCVEEGYKDLEGVVLQAAGRSRLLQQRPHEAAGLYRRGLALGSVAGLQARLDCAIGLARVLVSMDSSSSALATLEAEEPLLKGRESERIALEFRLEHAACRLKCGQTGQAREEARLVAAGAARTGLQGYRVRALSLAGRACIKTGNRSDALSCLLQAAKAWEEERAAPSDPEWREQRGTEGGLIYSNLAAILLGSGGGVIEGERVRDAFDRVQIFKARTLQERIVGPRGAGGARAVQAPVALDRLQDGVLDEGEVFLDFYLGPDVSVLFAVGPAEARAVLLPGGPGIEARARRLYELLASPPEGSRVEMDRSLEAPLRALSDSLLAGVSDLVSGARRVLVSTDGALALLPSAVFTRAEEGRPGQDCCRVPSATVLAMLREDATCPRECDPPLQGTGAPRARACRILALAGSRNIEGDALPGAVAEVGRIERRCRNVECRVFGLREREPDPAGLPSCQILHIAADLLTDDQSPWRSEIRFDGPSSAPNWSAGHIAACRLSPRLTVLSGCASAGTAPAAAEGLLGLSSAFLSAGSRAVVATLWPVDDRATLAVTSRLYSMLAQGRTAAEALRSAQESIRESPQTRSCFYWAGFVLIGDGSLSLPVESRPHREWIVAGACLGLAALLAWIGLRTGRRHEGGSPQGRDSS